MSTSRKLTKAGMTINKWRLLPNEHLRPTWSSEEGALLARQEARLTVNGTRFLNQALVPLFPDRTLESIKGQRRYKKHKGLVLKMIKEIQEDPLPPTIEVAH